MDKYLVLVTIEKLGTIISQINSRFDKSQLWNNYITILIGFSEINYHVTFNIDGKDCSSLNIPIDSNTSIHLQAFYESLIAFLKKLHMLNCHLNFSVYHAPYELISEFNCFSIDIPGFDMMIKYLERSFDRKIPQDNYTFTTKSFLDRKFKVEYLLLFHNFSENSFDIILSNNRIINSPEAKLTCELLKNPQFAEILSENLGIEIIDSNLNDINKISIKSCNSKSVMMVFNIISNNDDDIIFIEDLVEVILISVKEIREKNMLLALNRSERKIFNEYAVNYNIISRSLLTVYKLTSNEKVFDAIKQLSGNEKEFLVDAESSDEFQSKINQCLCKNSFLNLKF